MVSIITIYTNAAVIMTMTIVVIVKKFTHYMTIATKTMTKFLKKFNFHFSFKNRSFFIILPTKFISLNCTLPRKIP